PPNSSPFCGYERLASKNTVVLMDTGKPESRKTARRAMAGTLSFELSSDKTRFIANCGVPAMNYGRYAPYFRTTAAHSTATIAHSSSSRFAGSGRLRDMLPSPLVHAPTNVVSERSVESGYDHIFACHDGYEPDFGMLHERELFLAKDGTELNGIDRFKLNQPGPAHDIHIRFHLPPNISSSPLSSGHSILLAGPHGDAWKLTCIDAPMQLEESLYFSGPDQPRKTQQIVISTTSLDHGEIRWSLSYRAAQRTARKQRSGQAAPDLLDTLQDSLLVPQD
ncbi:MAG: heparinase II/III domain-containing protein, partial [Rhizobiaceae bacterium]